MIVADGDVPDPVVTALKTLGYDIKTCDDLGLPVRMDPKIMAGALAHNSILLTMDTGVPSQAYLFELAQNGLSVVVLRWKVCNCKAFQEMALAILRDGEDWQRKAANDPCVISVNNRKSRCRSWSNISPNIAKQGQVRFKRDHPDLDPPTLPTSPTAP